MGMLKWEIERRKWEVGMWKWEMPDSGKIESVLRRPVFFIEKTLDMLILNDVFNFIRFCEI